MAHRHRPLWLQDVPHHLNCITQFPRWATEDILELVTRRISWSTTFDDLPHGWCSAGPPWLTYPSPIWCQADPIEKSIPEGFVGQTFVWQTKTVLSYRRKPVILVSTYSSPLSHAWSIFSTLMIFDVSWEKTRVWYIHDAISDAMAHLLLGSIV